MTWWRHERKPSLLWAICDLGGKVMAKDEHNKAAEHHENAAKAHRNAAQQHGSGDHAKGKQHSTEA